MKPKYKVGDVLIEHHLHANTKYIVQIIEIKEDKYYFLYYKHNKIVWSFIHIVDNNLYYFSKYKQPTDEEKLELL